MVMFFCAHFFDAAMGFLCVLTDVRRSFVRQNLISSAIIPHFFRRNINS